jgi:hypothetical protein
MNIFPNYFASWDLKQFLIKTGMPARVGEPNTMYGRTRDLKGRAPKIKLFESKI